MSFDFGGRPLGLDAAFDTASDTGSVVLFGTGSMFLFETGFVIFEIGAVFSFFFVTQSVHLHLPAVPPINHKKCRKNCLCTV